MVARRQIPGILSARANEIRALARTALVEVWHRRREFPAEFQVPIDDPEAFVRMAHVLVPQCLHGFEVIPQQQIPSDDPTFEIAGIIDRHAKQILVARKFGLEVCRFTVGHEVGHLILHPGRIYHRDRPLTESAYLDSRRPAVEREADIFAAELLMPSKLVTEIFLQCFGEPIHSAHVSDDLCYRLSNGAGKRLSPREFRSMNEIDRAAMIAQLSEFGLTSHRSLCSRFGVSVTAMAIRLRELGLVV